jgi:hypothetical protein
MVLGIFVAAVAGTAVGCASSSKQTASETEASDSAKSGDEATSRETSNDASGAEEEPDATSDEKERAPVRLGSLLGSDTSEGLPARCPEEWSELEDRDYDGTIYACEGFPVPERYRQPTVMIGVNESIVRRVTMQAFYEGGEPIKQMYAAVTDRYEQKCDADGASGKAMSFICDEYVAQIAHRKRTGSLRIILGLKNWDMPN